jgi:hypothetical protein
MVIAKILETKKKLFIKVKLNLISEFYFITKLINSIHQCRNSELDLDDKRNFIRISKRWFVAIKINWIFHLHHHNIFWQLFWLK